MIHHAFPNDIIAKLNSSMRELILKQAKIDEHQIECLLSNAIFLENLVVKDSSGFGNIKLNQATRLKNLVLVRCFNCLGSI